MDRILSIVVITAFVGYLASAEIASAEMIQGKVVEIGPGAEFLKVMRRNPETGKPQELKLAVKMDTALSGVDSLESLKVGDEVSIEAARHGLTRQLEAKAISTGNGMTDKTQGPPRS